MTATDLPNNLSETVVRLFSHQLATWPEVRRRYASLPQALTRELRLHGATYRLQHNPDRVRSSAARVDRQSIAARPCFLCLQNRPKEQLRLGVLGRYEVLVNPYPIFPQHLTIVATEHCPQAIDAAAQGSCGRDRFAPLRDLLLLAQALPDYTLFYNGPRSGASAPDHLHFQAGTRGVMPIEHDWRGRVKETWTADDEGRWQAVDDEARRTYSGACLHHLDDAPRHALVVEATDVDAAIRLFACIYRDLQGGGESVESDEEPMLNLLARHEGGRWLLFVFPRKAHRPTCYSIEGEGRMLISPASVDLGGLFVLPVEVDFRRMDAAKLEEILWEVCREFPFGPQKDTR